MFLCSLLSSAWFCIDIVRRNSVSVTREGLKFNSSACMKACMLYFSISTAINYVSLTKHFMHIYKVEVLWYVTLFMLLTTGSLMDCHQNCLWNVKFLIPNAHNYLCRIQECWKKNSAMTIILKIISWRKNLPRNRKLTCSSKNSVISGVIVTWTKLHPVKQSNVWKKKKNSNI